MFGDKKISNPNRVGMIKILKLNAYICYYNINNTMIFLEALYG